MRCIRCQKKLDPETEVRVCRGCAIRWALRFIAPDDMTSAVRVVRQVVSRRYRPTVAVPVNLTPVAVVDQWCHRR